MISYLTFVSSPSCVCVPQEMTYRYFELGKNADPEREDSGQFKNAFTVHPVSEPNLMYRLHKRFSQIELEWTYLQIQQLQVCYTSEYVVSDEMTLSGPMSSANYFLFCFPLHHTRFEPRQSFLSNTVFIHAKTSEHELSHSTVILFSI